MITRVFSTVFLHLRLWILRYQSVKFRQWAELEDKKAEALLAAEEYADDFPEKVYAYLSAAINIPIDYTVLSWDKVLHAFVTISAKLSPKKLIPLIDTKDIKKKDNKKEVWEYSGRAWYLYLHLFASRYNWTEDVIANMNVDDALPLLQEILVDQQTDREFLWSMAEVAYPYNKDTKKSVFSPLPRPLWMQPKKPEKEHKTRIPKKFLPIGNVVDTTNGEEIKSK